MNDNIIDRKPSKKRKKSAKSGRVISIPDNGELKYLEKIVLGTGTDVFQDTPSDEESDSDISGKKKRVEEAEKEPAWVDEDDSVTFSEVVEKQGRKCKPGVSGSKKYEAVTKQKYQQVMGLPKWSKISSKNENSGEDILTSCGNFIKKPKFLANGLLEFKKLKNLNFETRSEGPFVNVVKFHPKSTVAMVAGASGIVSLFQVDGKQNAKLQSLKFHKFPISCGSFLKCGDELIVGSPYHNFFYCHDLMTGKSMKINNSKLIEITKTKHFIVSPRDDFIAVCGNTGKIFLFTTSTKEYIDYLQMNCNVNAIEFSQDGSLLYSHGDDGEVYVWDMNSRSCIKKFYDDGCLKGTSVGISPNNQFIACGSSSGIVNIYDCKSVHSGDHILPIKSVFNLLTPITNVLFNPSSEILAVASNQRENAVKLVHCPSMTVFSNFPQFNSKIGKPLCLNFSPNGGFFSIGDDRQCAHLFRLKYYGNY